MLLIQGDRDPGSYKRYLRLTIILLLEWVKSVILLNAIAFSGLIIYVMEIISRLLKSTAIIFMSP